MAAPQLPPEVEEKEDWLITYADAITLLMAFMVMLLTFSEYDIPAFEEAAAAIESNLTGRDATSPIQLLKIDVQDVVYNMQADQVVKVEVDDKGVVIELSASAFYQPGSAVIREEAHPVLEKMSQTFLAPRYQNYVIEIEGHTDNDPINTAQFPSNWELSAGRAAGVVRFLTEQGLEPFKMKATGYAETRPKAPNMDAQGNPIVENKSANRRVAIRIYPMSLNQRTEFLDILQRKEQAEKAAASRLPPAEQSGGAPDTAPKSNN
jgi:chemotaxis protein MotB